MNVQSQNEPKLRRTLGEWIHIPTPGDHYSPRTGSAIITVIQQMTRWHQAAGGKSQVLVAAGTWDGYDDGARREVQFSRLGTPSKFAKFVDGSLGALTGRRILSGKTYAAAADHLGKQFDGVVFVHNEPSAVELLARRCPNARICLWVQNQLFRTYTRRQARRVVHYAHRVICCSNFIARGVSDAAGDNHKIATVTNGVDSEFFRPTNRPASSDVPLILFVGRMVPEKGPDLLLKAAIELKHRKVNFRLRIVGSRNFNAADGLTPFETTLRNLAAVLGDSAEFRPFRPRAEVVQEYQSADILCVPSAWDDPCPLTVLEGMSCGLALVVSKRGGIPEEAGPVASYFDTNDHMMLSEHLLRLVKDPVALNTAKEASRLRVLDWDWRFKFQQLCAVIATPLRMPC